MDIRFKKQSYFFFGLLIFWFGYSPANPAQKILFIGNSYTFANNLPNMVAELAKSGGHSLDAQMSAVGGWFLSDHEKSAEVLKKIKFEKWNWIVLQEQSQIPAVESMRKNSMYPPARTLVEKIREIGALPMFFSTWAHLNGWPDNGIKDYETMQNEINIGYQTISDELHATIVPVGASWAKLHLQQPTMPLWSPDGSHPSEMGTYLAACVFYKTLFNQSPIGLKYHAGLSNNLAKLIQTAAE